LVPHRCGEKIHNKFANLLHEGTLGLWLKKIVDREAVGEDDITPKQEDIIEGRGALNRGINDLLRTETSVNKIRVS
jgi:hypothetical protein